MGPYQSFLSSINAEKWKRIGLQRRAGIAAPLFSVYSKKSAGIGEIPDLNLLVDWCVKTGLGILQLLPLNDVGFRFTPYDAVSTFALEPMYLSLEKLKDSDLKPFRKKIQDLKAAFPCPKKGEALVPRVDYRLKKAKLELLEGVFLKNFSEMSKAFRRFTETQRSWLEDYSAFKVLKQNYGQASWESWKEEHRKPGPAVLEKIKKDFRRQSNFEKWLQWQLFEQFKQAKKYAAGKGVFLMGDLPFLVSKDSADVWAHQDYFKMDRVAGAPPDAFFAKGQRWGMPPYDWERIAAHDFDYLKERLHYAGNFYDFFRIDHAVGTFRLWTVDLKEPLENGGLFGVFDPPEEGRWEEHGRGILSVMVRNTRMLPCAEDLGVIPACSFRVLEEFAVPGMDVQRWTKHWDTTGDFKAPEAYRKNSAAVLSTHDTTSFGGWWEVEAGTIDAEMFERICRAKEIPFENVKEKLFDLAASAQGRLRWRPEVKDSGTLCRLLERSEQDVHEITAIYRASYDEKRKFWDYAGLEGEPSGKVCREILQAALRKIHETASIFSIQLLQDWLGFGGMLLEDPWQSRINFPGTLGEQNWTWVMPFSLEEMKKLKMNPEIRKLNQETGRAN